MKVLLLLYMAAQGWGEVREAFEKEWASGEPARQKASVAKMQSEDYAESAELLMKVGRGTDRKLEQLHEKKLQIHKEMKKYPADQILDSRGEIGKRDWYNKRLALDQQSKLVQHQIMGQEDLLTAIGDTVAQYKSEGAVRILLKDFRRSSTIYLRYALARALRGIPDAKAEAALCQVVDTDRDVALVGICIQSLAVRKGAVALSTVLSALKRDEWQVQRAAADALVERDVLAAIEPLIEVLANAEGRMRVEMNLALVALTGEDRHEDASAWKDWWSRNRDGFAAKRLPLEKRRALQASARSGKGDASTTFYGIPIKSKRMIFVLDRSLSMSAKAAWVPKPDVASGGGAKPEKIGDRKIDVCKYELKKAIRSLPEDAAFNVFFYNRDIIVLNPGDMIQAKKANKERAIRFIDGIEPIGVTNIFDTMEKAMGFRTKGDAYRDQVDTLFLLSDGMPNCGQFQNPDPLRDGLKRINTISRIVVHTIYTGAEAAGLSLLKSIAADHLGRFVDRSQPEK